MPTLITTMANMTIMGMAMTGKGMELWPTMPLSLLNLFLSEEELLMLLSVCVPLDGGQFGMLLHSLVGAALPPLLRNVEGRQVFGTT